MFLVKNTEKFQCWSGRRIRSNDVTSVWVWSFSFISQQNRVYIGKAMTTSDWLVTLNHIWAKFLWLAATGAQRHLDAEATIRQEVAGWQEAATWQSPCARVPCLPLHFCSSVPCSLFSRPISETKLGLLKGTKVCPLSSSQDSTFQETWQSYPWNLF